MDQRKKYKSAPIQEAICEVHFVLPEPLSRETITDFGRAWKKEYPDQRTVEEKTFCMEIALGKSQVKEEVIGHKLLARSQDGKNIVQLSPSFLAVNRLSPYTGWEESFRSVILSRFEEAHAAFHFQGIKQIDLRYINRIELPEPLIEWKKWFNVSPPVPTGIAKEPQVLQSQIQLPLGDGLLATINIATLEGQKMPTVVLDIDVVWKGNVSIGELPTMLDKVHLPHNILFESYLTDSLRSVFIPI